MLHKLLIIEVLTSKGDYDDSYRSRGNPVHTPGSCPPPLLNFLLPLVPLSQFPMGLLSCPGLPVLFCPSLWLKFQLCTWLLPREKRSNKFYHVFTLDYALLGSVGEKSNKTSRSSCSSAGWDAGCVSAPTMDNEKCWERAMGRRIQVMEAWPAQL